MNGLHSGDLRGRACEGEEKGVRRMYTYHLLCSHAHGFHSKLAPTHVEQVFEVGTEEIDNEDIVKALLSKVMDLRNAG